MSLKSRGSGLPLRGGSGGGGSISVGTTDGTDDTILSPSVKEILWNTSQFGFTATVDPDDETKVIIGVPAEFENKISWSNITNTLVRVAESDPSEPDPFEAGGFENTNLGATNDANPRWNSTLGRGLGPNASLLVTVKYAGTVVDSQTFTANANGVVTLNCTTVTISNFADDGDGSAQKGNISVRTDLNAMIGDNFSGNFDILIRFTEHKWGEVITFTENFFYDKNPNTPVITGATTIREDDTPANRITKYLSGIQYYTTGSPFTLEAFTIDNHNQDSSHPNASLMLGSALFGIADFTSSPWVDTADWSNVGNLDTSQGFDFSTSKTIDIPNYRHVGNAAVDNIIRDSWGQAANKPSNTVRVAIDTVVNPSTDSVEYFDEENKRLANDYTAAWDSERYCIDGEGVVYGGSLFQGSDLPRILDNVLGGAGSAGSLASCLPNETVGGISRQNPNYSGHGKDAVFLRKFLTPDGNSYQSINITGLFQSGTLESNLKAGNIIIYLWKINSSGASNNARVPPVYTPATQSAGTENSIWVNGNTFSFGTFDDGDSGTAAGSSCVRTFIGNTVEATFGGFNCVDGVYARIQVKKGTVLQELSFTFV